MRSGCKPWTRDRERWTVVGRSIHFWRVSGVATGSLSSPAWAYRYRWSSEVQQQESAVLAAMTILSKESLHTNENFPMQQSKPSLAEMFCHTNLPKTVWIAFVTGCYLTGLIKFMVRFLHKKVKSQTAACMLQRCICSQHQRKQISHSSNGREVRKTIHYS